MSDYDRELAKENWKTAVELYAINRAINDELDRLRAEVARLRAALEAVEWVQEDIHGPYHQVYCPWCLNLNLDHQKHDPTCQRQIALGLGEKEGEG